MKIIELQISNVKKIVAVNIKPDGSLVVIGGKNGAGKTSVLDSIAYLLGGKSLIPDQPIRKGETKATIIADLGDYKVERTFTNKGSYLRITDANGSATNSPQKLLDRIFNKHSADPLAFAQSEPRKQAELLRKITGVDTTELDVEHKRIYEERRMKGQEIVEPVKPENMRDKSEEIIVSDVMMELERRQKINHKNSRVRRDLRISIGNTEELGRDRNELEEKFLKIKAALKENQMEIEQSEIDTKTHQVAVDNLVDLDEQEITEQVKSAEWINEGVRAAKHYQQEIAEHGKRQREYGGMTTKLNEIEKQKSDTIASATFPIDGLGFDGEGVTFQGLPFNQASQAERLRVSVAMALATNPELKVILIRDGSLLDDSNLEMIHEMAEKAGAQVWIERVGDGPEVSILIEEGEIVGKEAGLTQDDGCF